jgi:hypothetical protein
MSDPDEFRGRRRHWHVRTRCLCGDDLPGTCPGPEQCPYSGVNDPPEDMEEIEAAGKGATGEFDE